ncbi:MAG TPA: DNA/RNA nuclease SfsA [Candidatus Methylomirabilis sp.]
MEFGPLTPGRFVRRLNRFVALVEVDGGRALAHVANSGRLRELLVPGHRVYLKPVSRPDRRCAYDLALVRARGTLVSADARLPNVLLAEALRDGRIAVLRGFRRARREVRHGRSRLDFLLERAGARCLVEAKSVTLVEGGVALFPDAPTSRGRRHVEALTRAVRRAPPPGGPAGAERTEAAVVFVVQRGDADWFCPNGAADPAFARALVRAAAAGVRIMAYRCRVTRKGVTLADAIGVRIRSHDGRVNGCDRGAVARKAGVQPGSMPSL